MKQTADKIVSIAQAMNIVEQWRKKDLNTVFTNGCFDVIHLGHVDYLEKASKLGQKLVVAVNSDESVRRLKGVSRPINNQNARSRIIAALGFVDLVIVFEEDTPINLIESLKPQVLVKGNDYKIDNIVGSDIVTQNGGEVKTIELVQGYSTTGLIEKMTKEK